MKEFAPARLGRAGDAAAIVPEAGARQIRRQNRTPQNFPEKFATEQRGAKTMIQVRPSEERGRNKLSWLDTHFTFSFDQYYDPEHVQFRSLRVLNEDVVAPGGGFPMHPHRDMEILTWILDGGARTSRQHRRQRRDPSRGAAAHVRGNRRDAQRIQLRRRRIPYICCRSGSCRNARG